MGSQLQPNLSCPQMDEKLKALSDLQQLVPNFPSEDIIPFDQEDECCSNSVVDGLDKLLSDDDIEDDIENLSNTITDNVGYADKLTKPPQEEITRDLEVVPAHEYNLFNTFDQQKDPVSSHWEGTEHLCDKPHNVIHSPDMLVSQ